MLRYDIVSYDLEKGLNEGVDPIEIGGAGALELNNVRHQQHGKWAKRYGLTGLTKTDGITSGKSLIVYRDRLSMTGSDGSMWSYSQVENGWRQSQGVPVPIAHERTVGDFPAPVLEYDAVLCNGYLVVVWTVQPNTSSLRELWSQIFDINTSAPIVGASKIKSNADNYSVWDCKLAVCGLKVVCAWSQGTNGKIRGLVLDTTSSTTVTSGWGSPADIVTDMRISSGDSGTFDIHPSAAIGGSGQFFLLYVNTNTTSATAKLINVVGFGTVASNTAVVGAFQYITTVAVHSCAEGVWAAVGTQDGGIDNRVFIDRLNAGTLVGSGYAMMSGTFMTIKDGGAVSRLSVYRYSSTQAIIGWSSDGNTSTVGANANSTMGPQPTSHWAVSNTAGSRQGAESVMTCVTTVSRITMVNSRFYQYVAVVSASQPTYAMVEIGQTDSDAAGTYTLHPVRQCLWSPLLARPALVSTMVNVLATSASRVECVGPILSGSSRTFVMRRLQAHFDDPLSLVSHTQFSRVPIIEGGFEWDGSRVHELGFDHYPEPPRWSVLNNGAGAMTAGTYQYCFVFRYMDGAGNVIRSVPSVPISVAVSGAGKGVYIYPRGIGLTMKQRPIKQDFTGATKSAPKIFIETYRTQQGGDVFYLLTTGNSSGEAGLENTILEGAWNVGEPYYVDTISDTALLALGYGRLYTEGGRNAYYPPPSLHGFVRTSTRLWGIAPDDETLYYSEVESSGRLASFHPTQTVKISETLVAIATIQDQVFALSRSNVHRIVGDGLTPNGGGQPPYVTSLNMPGCVSPNSIVATSDGIFYRDSNNTISVIGGKASAYGEAVKTTLQDNPYTFDAIYWKEGAEVRMSIGPSSTSTTGVEVVYHMLRDAWTVNRYWDADTGTASRAIVSYALWDDPSIVSGSNNALMVLMSGGKVYKIDVGTYLDSGTWVEQSIAFPWMRGVAPQIIGRVGRAAVTGRYRTRCNLLIDMAADYSDTWETAALWKASENDASLGAWVGGVQRLGENIGRKCDAFRVRIRDQQPDSGPLSTGEGFNLLDVSFELGFEVTNKQGHLGKLGKLGARR